MIIIYIIVVLYLLVPILSFLTVPLEFIYRRKLGKVQINQNDYKDIYVLLPALKEQKIVKDTIDWFSKIKYNGKIKFIIITSEKEDYEYRINKVKDKTTRIVVSDEIKRINDKRFLNYHYKETNGNKSSQLNYAVNKIKEEVNNYQDVFISVFDFDSRPDVNTFNDMAVVIKNKNPDVIQQLPLNISNYGKSSIIMMVYSLQHLVRSFAIEKMKILISSLTPFKIPQYMMGACMHIRLDVLLNNGCFPIFVDDLTLGYRLSIKSYRFSYLPNDNLCLIPNDLSGYLGSATLIFKGITTYLKEVFNVKGHYYGRIKMLIFGSFNVLEFTIIPFIFIFYYIYSLVTFNFNIWFYLMILVPILWSISSYLLVRGKVGKINHFKNIVAIFISPIWFFIRPMGFFIYFYKKIKSLIFKSEINYKKTER